MFDDFEVLLKEYEPMIYHMLNKYQVRDFDGELYQELVITLWQATKQYEQGKMKFSTYAYAKMNYRLLDLFRKQSRVLEGEEIVYQENKKIAVIYEPSYETDYIFLQQIRAILTDREWLWFKGQILQGKTLVEMGHEHGVKANAVRHWKRKAVAKIRHFWNKEH
ncbi:sigma-70 family RNA polymerase sigma factor [Amphibacillus sp. MSJ-3]|uniref:sigma-70 family RNA polymerase sigma factor n=1 Tax=Amphibacillus sp. MSJ-3 TaxID=2841505 RepID=UPI001C0F24B6|nr:sigma-70 family RNA polymerase sigma factor [Amphibacillus sp. MSJ-3]MBU5595527.1 sigma-70 family RNA polymerase sigma factor [Amphibacillus sp. MSJ-3]